MHFSKKESKTMNIETDKNITMVYLILNHKNNYLGFFFLSWNKTLDNNKKKDVRSVCIGGGEE